MASVSVIDSKQELAPSIELKPTMRVLVVEDDPFTLTIMQKRLSMGGYTIATANNGREGMELFESFKPDLIISDWMMPEMDGREFCARVKASPHGASIYFILLTAKDRYEDKVSALDTGADEYLVKPCDGRELMARLRAAERILRLQQELSQSNAHLQSALKRINAELEATSLIQRRLLPQVLPEVSGYSFAAHYQPSTECSGDFYDLLPLENGKLGVAIGDVSGHGTPAMVAMAVTHMLLHLEAAMVDDPATLLFNLNNKMFAHLPTDQYVTVFYGILDPQTGHFTYSSAGHNPPLIADYQNQQFQYLTGCEGFPTKLIAPNMTYDNHEIQLLPAQHLILYTDGLPEALNSMSEAFGPEGLQNSISLAEDRSSCGIMETVLADLGRFLQGEQLEDDLSMLVVSRL